MLDTNDLVLQEALRSGSNANFPRIEAVDCSAVMAMESFPFCLHAGDVALAMELHSEMQNVVSGPYVIPTACGHEYGTATPWTEEFPGSGDGCGSHCWTESQLPPCEIPDRAVGRAIIRNDTHAENAAYSHRLILETPPVVDLPSPLSAESDFAEQPVRGHNGGFNVEDTSAHLQAGEGRLSDSIPPISHHQSNVKSHHAIPLSAKDSENEDACTDLEALLDILHEVQDDHQGEAGTIEEPQRTDVRNKDPTVIVIPFANWTSMEEARSAGEAAEATMSAYTMPSQAGSCNPEWQEDSSGRQQPADTHLQQGVGCHGPSSNDGTSVSTPVTTGDSAAHVGGNRMDGCSRHCTAAASNVPAAHVDLLNDRSHCCSADRGVDRITAQVPKDNAANRAQGEPCRWLGERWAASPTFDHNQPANSLYYKYRRQQLLQEQQRQEHRQQEQQQQRRPADLTHRLAAVLTRMRHPHSTGTGIISSQPAAGLVGAVTAHQSIINPAAVAVPAGNSRLCRRNRAMGACHASCKEASRRTGGGSTGGSMGLGTVGVEGCTYPVGVRRRKTSFSVPRLAEFQEVAAERWSAAPGNLTLSSSLACSQQANDFRSTPCDPTTDDDAPLFAVLRQRLPSGVWESPAAGCGLDIPLAGGSIPAVAASQPSRLCLPVASDGTCAPARLPRSLPLSLNCALRIPQAMRGLSMEEVKALMLALAEAVAEGDTPRMRSLHRELVSASSPMGPAPQRAAHYFAHALASRAAGQGFKQLSASLPYRHEDRVAAENHYMSATPFLPFLHTISSAAILSTLHQTYHNHGPNIDHSHPSALCDYQRVITPRCHPSPGAPSYHHRNKCFARLSGYDGRRNNRPMERLHIIDFGPELGFHWASLIRELASRPQGPPYWLKITTINVVDARFPAVSERLREVAGQLHVALKAAAEEASLPSFIHEVVEAVEGEEDVVTSLRRRVRVVSPAAAASARVMCGCTGKGNSNRGRMRWGDFSRESAPMLRLTGECDSNERVEYCASKRARASSPHSAQETGSHRQEHSRIRHYGNRFETAAWEANGWVHGSKGVHDSAGPHGVGVFDCEAVHDCCGSGRGGWVGEEERGVVAVCSAIAMEDFFDETAMRHSQRDALIQWIESLQPDVFIDLSMDLDARGPFFIPRAEQCFDYQSTLLHYHDALCGTTATGRNNTVREANTPLHYHDALCSTLMGPQEPTLGLAHPSLCDTTASGRHPVREPNDTPRQRGNSDASCPGNDQRERQPGEYRQDAPRDSWFVAAGLTGSFDSSLPVTGSQGPDSRALVNSGAEILAALCGKSREELRTNTAAAAAAAAAAAEAASENPPHHLEAGSIPLHPPDLHTGNTAHNVALSELDSLPVCAPSGLDPLPPSLDPLPPSLDNLPPSLDPVPPSLDPLPPGVCRGESLPSVFRPYVLMFEHLFVSANVTAMVACEGLERVKRPEGLASWRRRMRRTAFVPSGCLPAVAERAGEVVGRYRSCGVGMVRHRDAVQLTWMGRPLLYGSVWGLDRELLE